MLLIILCAVAAVAAMRNRAVLRGALVERTLAGLEGITTRFRTTDNAPPRPSRLRSHERFDLGALAHDVQAAPAAYHGQTATIPQEDLLLAAGVSLGALVIGLGVVAAQPTLIANAHPGPGLNINVVSLGFVLKLASVARLCGMFTAILGGAGLCLAGFLATEKQLGILWHYVCWAQPPFVMAAGGVLVVPTLGLVIIAIANVAILIVVLVVFCFMWGLPTSPPNTPDPRQ